VKKSKRIRKIKKLASKVGARPSSFPLPKAEDLLRWYDLHGRILPWRSRKRETPDPYKVWLSEIMLQQTTVPAVKPYFLKFIHRWPTLKSLAVADEEDVLRLWAGLGYYRRARMLIACAKELWHNHKGMFPQDEEALRTLPGIGAYTSAAIMAIAFGRKANVVDGNVERVVSRIFSIKAYPPAAKKKIKESAGKLVPESRCGDYAQALMDLGSEVCLPKGPLCPQCPWKKSCLAREQGIQDSLPRRERKKEKPIRKTVAYVLRDKDGRVLIRKRPIKGLLAGMMEVPSSPWQEGKALDLCKIKSFAPHEANWEELPGIVKHIFSHFVLEAKIVVAVTGEKIPGRWVSVQDLEREALPSVMKKIVTYAIKAL